MHFSVHTKRNAEPTDPQTMRVDYEVGLARDISEWICVEHSGFALGKARTWWDNMSDDPMPEFAQDAVNLAQSGKVRQVLEISVKKTPGSTFPEIVNRVLGEYLPIREPPDAIELPPVETVKPEPQLSLF